MPALNIPYLWQQGFDCANTVIVVLDSGVDLAHQDLQTQLFVNTLEIAADGIDNDNNGWVDDVSGISFLAPPADRQSTQDIANYNCPATASFNANQAKNCGAPWDDGDRIGNFFTGGHGTHVAGIAVAAHNQVGIQGVCSKAMLLPIRFLNKNSSGELSNALLGIEYVNKLAVQPEFAHLQFIINNSWLDDQSPPLLFELAQQSLANNVIWVNAAGNQGIDLSSSPKYPANLAADYANIYTIANHTAEQSLHNYSNFAQHYVTAAVAGTDMFSTYPSWLSVAENSVGEYRSFTGTSMAAPVFTGLVAALTGEQKIISINQNEQLKAALRSSTPFHAEFISKVQLPVLIDSALWQQNLQTTPSAIATRFKWLNEYQIQISGYQLEQVTSVMLNGEALPFELLNGNLIVEFDQSAQSGLLSLNGKGFDFIELPVANVGDFTVQFERASNQFIFSWQPVATGELIIEQCLTTGGYEQVASVAASASTVAINANDYCKNFRAKVRTQVQNPIDKVLESDYSQVVNPDMPLPNWATQDLASVPLNTDFSRQLRVLYEYDVEFYSCAQLALNCEFLPQGLSLSKSGMLSGQVSSAGAYELNIVVKALDTNNLVLLTIRLFAEAGNATLYVNEHFSLQYSGAEPLADWTGIINEQGLWRSDLMLESEARFALIKLKQLGDLNIKKVWLLTDAGEWQDANAQISPTEVQWLVNNDGETDSSKLADKINMQFKIELAEPNKPQQDSRCFIATALYGQDHQITQWYRNQRDQHLVNNALGRELVDGYYQNSPLWIHTWLANEKTKLAVEALLLAVYYLSQGFVVLFILLVACLLLYWLKPTIKLRDEARAE